MGQLNRTVALSGLIVLAAVIVLLRLHTYDEPLERDLTTYAVVAHEMIGGKALYSDLWDHKPPAIHVTYAAAELIAGYGRDSIFLLNIAAAIATMIGCYFAGRTIGGAVGGLSTAAFWALAAGDLALEGNQPNTELFLNTFLSAGFAVCVCAPREGLGWRRSVAAGVLFAVASLYKQVIIAHVALLALVYFATTRRGSRKRAIVDLATIGTMAVTAWALVFGYFALRGHGEAFIDAVFKYNRWYAAAAVDPTKHIFGWPPVFADVLAVILPLATLSFAGLLVGLTAGPRRPWLLLLAFAAATHVAVLLPGHFYPHYYQLWLPPLVIGAGWSVGLLKRVLVARLSWLSYVTAAVTCMVLVLMAVPYYRLSPQIWSFRKYGMIFIETERLAVKLDRLFPRNITLFEWGNETGLYFETQRKPPSGVVYAYPVQAGPLALKLSGRVLAELKDKLPDVVVTAKPVWVFTAGHPITKWLRENYRPVWQTENFMVRVRKGSAADGLCTVQRTNRPLNPTPCSMPTLDDVQRRLLKFVDPRSASAR